MVRLNTLVGARNGDVTSLDIFLTIIRGARARALAEDTAPIERTSVARLGLCGGSLVKQTLPKVAPSRPMVRSFGVRSFGAGLPSVKQSRTPCSAFALVRRERGLVTSAAARCACATHLNPATLQPGNRATDARTACCLLSAIETFSGLSSTGQRFVVLDMRDDHTPITGRCGEIVGSRRKLSALIK